VSINKKKYRTPDDFNALDVPRFAAGVCGQGNGDRGMVLSLVDALVVIDLAQLGVELDTTVALPLHAAFRITISNAHDQRHGHSPVPIPLSQKTCAKRFEERALTCLKNESSVNSIFLDRSKSENLEGEGPPEPVRLRTTEMVANFGSRLMPFVWNQACP